MRAPKNGQMPDFNQFAPPVRKRQSDEEEESKIYTNRDPMDSTDQRERKERAPASKKVLTFGSRQPADSFLMNTGNPDQEIITLVEQINRNLHHELMDMNEYLKIYKKLEKFMHHDISNADIKKGSGSLS